MITKPKYKSLTREFRIAITDSKIQSCDIHMVFSHTLNKALSNKFSDHLPVDFDAVKINYEV